MDKSVFEKAKKWICLHARPVDRERYRYQFENGSREAVLSALKEYQNEDGGFGHALEADCFNPNSSPIQTWAATEILHEISMEENHPMIQGILKYLDSGKDFNGSCWLNTIPSNNDYPRAPWWTYDSQSYDRITYNPTAALAGFALRFADRESALYKKCYGIAQEAIRYLKETDQCDEMHVLACFVRMTEYCRKAGLTDDLSLDEAEQLISKKIHKIMTWDKASWGTGYVCKPSQFFMNKESFLYHSFMDIAHEECVFIKKAQKPDGTWSINWQWENDLDQWYVALNWWKAHLIIMNLRFLQGISGA